MVSGAEKALQALFHLSDLWTGFTGATALIGTIVAALLPPDLFRWAIAMFNQLSGINAMMYYAPRIFEITGEGEGVALLQSIAIARRGDLGLHFRDLPKCRACERPGPRQHHALDHGRGLEDEHLATGS